MRRKKQMGIEKQKGIESRCKTPTVTHLLMCGVNVNVGNLTSIAAEAFHQASSRHTHLLSGGIVKAPSMTANGASGNY